jgi:hypothetical protein
VRQEEAVLPGLPLRLQRDLRAQGLLPRLSAVLHRCPLGVLRGSGLRHDRGFAAGGYPLLRRSRQAIRGWLQDGRRLLPLPRVQHQHRRVRGERDLTPPAGT